MDFPLTAADAWRLPRHPDWKYEYWDGEVHLRHRPRPLGLVRSTAEPVCNGDAHVAERLRPSGDREELERLLWEVWREEDPYRTYGKVEGRRVLRDELDESGKRLADPAGALVWDGADLAGALLLQRGDAHGHTPPVIAWLSVRAAHRRTGVASALLAGAVQWLRAAGQDQVRSAVSAANPPSLRWHLQHGFQLLHDPFGGPTAIEMPAQGSADVAAGRLPSPAAPRRG